VTEVLARCILSGYVDVFRADHLGYPDLAGQARQCWDLDALSAEYARFLSCYRPSARQIASHAPPVGRPSGSASRC
jgi:DNA-binding transcriptional regulator PaaX